MDHDTREYNRLADTVSEGGFAVIRWTAPQRLEPLLAKLLPAVVVLEPFMDGHDQGLDEASRLCLAAGVPMLVVSCRSTPEDIAHSLDAGASDHLGKPWHAVELMARLRRATRSAPESASSSLTVGQLRVWPEQRRAEVDGRVLRLTTLEFDLLLSLARHPGRVIHRDALLRQVWGHSIGDASTVTVHIRRLRAKLELDPSCPVMLKTRWGSGYWLDTGAGPIAEPPVADLVGQAAHD